MRKEYDFSDAVRNPYAARLRDKRWWVQFDPDLRELIFGDGNGAERLQRLASKSPRERIVTTIPMTELQYQALKPLLRRIKAKAKYVPEHPSAKFTAPRTPARRKAG